LFGEGSNAEEVTLGTETVETLNRSVRRAHSECAVCGSRVNANTRGTFKWSDSRATIGQRALALWSARSVRAEHSTGWAGKVDRVDIARCELKNTCTIRAFKWSACRAAICGEIAGRFISNTEAIRALVAEVWWASDWIAMSYIWGA
jgi:hypothetical protein